MAIDVDVVRVFTDSAGRHGNPLGIVDAAVVPAAERQSLAAHLGYSETIFVELPEPGATSARAQILTPATELPFAGHPTVGLSWWLRRRGLPVQILDVPAGPVATRADGELTWVRARADWAPKFTLHELADAESVHALAAADWPNGHHYLWAPTGEGAITSRMFAADMGVPEDEATGAAALRITAHLGYDLHITQGRGSRIETRVLPDEWIEVGGRVERDGPVTV